MSVLESTYDSCDRSDTFARMKNLVYLLLAFGLFACASGRGGKQAASSALSCPSCDCACGKQNDQAIAPAAANLPAADSHAAAPVPVTPQDPTWGNPDAPVTMVVFSDFQCPFCARVVPAVEELKRSYGPDQLRLVWKNLPLPFHAYARPAAEAAMAVFAVGGSDAFWKLHDRLFADQKDLDQAHFATWAGEAGVAPAQLSEAVAAKRGARKVSEDIALAIRLHISGTPSFLINGVPINGAQPVASFREIIDAQLAAAKALLASGLPAHAVYPALTAKNMGADADRPQQDSDDEDVTVWNVPVGTDDPARGPADALVTLVVFSDFQCPFCQRLESTLARLREKHGRELRIVWKDHPLPFHENAIPAAVLARVALDKKGQEGFWQAHDAIFANSSDLGRPALEKIARQIGLALGDVDKALADRRYQPLFDAVDALSDKLGAQGTPTSFVNGYRIAGALPFEAFDAVVEVQLASAKAMLDKGRPRAGLYQAIVGTGKPGTAPKGQERKELEPPTADNPSRGPADAKVTVQVFGDFECASSLQAMPVLAQVEEKFPGKIRFIWRNLPLPVHSHAALAAEAAQEVFTQKGAAAFWRYNTLLFAAQADGSLDRKRLEKLAKKVGVDMVRFRSALDSRRHKAAVDRDVEAAQKADIDETPTFVINGQLLAGAHPTSELEHIVSRALGISK